MPRASTARCGTPAGYYRHWSTGQPACPPCLHAKAAQSHARDRALTELGRRHAAERRALYRRKLAGQRAYPSPGAARTAAYKAAVAAVARRHPEEFRSLMEGQAA